MQFPEPGEAGEMGEIELDDVTGSLTKRIQLLDAIPQEDDIYQDNKKESPEPVVQKNKIYPNNKKELREKKIR